MVKMSKKAHETVMNFAGSVGTSYKDAMICMDWDKDRFNKLDDYISNLEKSNKKLQEALGDAIQMLPNMADELRKTAGLEKEL